METRDANTPRNIIVDANSASPQLPGVTYYGVEATHSQLCKFTSPSSPGFRALSTDIRQWALDAPAIISRRWDAELRDRSLRVQNELSERCMPAYMAHDMASSPKPVPRFASPAPETGYYYTTTSPPPPPQTEAGAMAAPSRFAGVKMAASPTYYMSAAPQSLARAPPRRPSSSSTVSIASLPPPPYGEEAGTVSASPSRRGSDLTIHMSRDMLQRVLGESMLVMNVDEASMQHRTSI